MTVDQSVGVDSVSGLFFLGFSPPPSLGWPPVSPQRAVCFRVKQAILWAAALAAVDQREKPGWSGRGIDGACSLKLGTLMGFISPP